MTIWLIRLFFVVLSVISGYYIGSDVSAVTGHDPIVGAFYGLGISFLVIILEARLKSVPLRNLSAAVFGIIFGFFMAWMMTMIARLIPMEEHIYPLLRIVFTLVFCYLGMVVSIKGKDEFNVIIPYLRFSRQDQKDQRYVIDTSVIIDGRIISVSETGFLEGKLVVPRFILHELQQVADSPDDEKRNRGRKGLDMLERLKGVKGVEVIIHEENFSSIREVDAKLVRLSKMLDAPLVTNDFNLNKVAGLEGVKVLNFNDLAAAMRPVVIPGERMTIHMRREGKERNQAVGFLDDGTMVVVDNGRRHIGRAVEVAVTSVLQTSAGRMIFADLVENDENNKDKAPSRPARRDRNFNSGKGEGRNNGKRQNNDPSGNVSA